MNINDFTDTQKACIKALNSLPNKMGSVSQIKSRIGEEVMQVAVTSAMLALIRKDNIEPNVKSKWIIRIPPKDNLGNVVFAMTNELKALLSQCEDSHLTVMDEGENFFRKARQEKTATQRMTADY